jgi:hypothetical protein
VTRRALPERIGIPLDQGLHAGERRCSHGYRTPASAPPVNATLAEPAPISLADWLRRAGEDATADSLLEQFLSVIGA